MAGRTATPKSKGKKEMQASNYNPPIKQASKIDRSIVELICACAAAGFVCRRNIDETKLIRSTQRWRKRRGWGGGGTGGLPMASSFCYHPGVALWDVMSDECGTILLSGRACVACAVTLSPFEPAGLCLASWLPGCPEACPEACLVPMA